MLKKKNRLLFLDKKTKNKFFDSSLLKVKVFSEEFEDPKFAFIVSKKIDKRAVVRNKIKRILRNEVEKVLENIKSGFGVIIIAKKNSIVEEKDEVNKEITGLFKKAEILK